VRTTLLSSFIGLFLATPGAIAKDSKAEACLRTKVWEGYADGWGIRSMTSAQVKARKTKNYLVTLYKGNEYQVATCADPSVKNLDVLLYDMNGNVLTRDTSADREPRITFEPETTGSYYVVLYLREAKSARIDAADVAMALVYK